MKRNRNRTDPKIVRTSTKSHCAGFGPEIPGGSSDSSPGSDFSLREGLLAGTVAIAGNGKVAGKY